MKNLKFVNIAVFILFFGLSIIEALQKHHWLLATLFFAVGALALWADFEKKETSMRKNVLVAIVALLVASGVVWYKEVAPPVAPLSLPVTSSEYRNTDYGFSITLPETWAGHTVSIDKWTGDKAGDQLGDVHFTDGPVVSIHNPKWTGVGSYQDIPIMVFTLVQWNDLQAEKFHIGAAPVNPSELGQNAQYVFALPARYNFSFPPGYEEVEQILESKPLTAF